MQIKQSFIDDIEEGQQVKSRWVLTIALSLLVIATVMPASASPIIHKVSRYYQVEFEPGTAIPTTQGRARAEAARMMQIRLMTDRFEIWGYGDIGQSGKAARKLADERMVVIARILTSGTEGVLPVVMHANDGTIPIERPADASDPPYGMVEVYCGEGPSDQESGKPWRHGPNVNKPRTLKPKLAH